MRNPLATLLLTFPLFTGAQVSPPVNAPPTPVQPQEPAQPQAEPTSTLPPPPVSAPTAPPMQMSAPPEPTFSPQAESLNVPPTDGQWVYTAQYGWVWMPFGPQFVFVPPGGAPPQMFLFYPAVGWRWVVAPWVWGLGPPPYWGVHGNARFPWWGSGFGRWYAFGPSYVGWNARYWWNGSRWVPTTRVYPPPRVVARSPHHPPRGWPRHRRW